MNTIEDKVKNLIAEVTGFELSKIKEKSHLIKDLQCDSLDIVELTLMLEEELQVEIPDEEAEKLFTVKQIIDYVKMYNKGTQPN